MAPPDRSPRPSSGLSLSVLGKFMRAFRIVDIRVFYNIYFLFFFQHNHNVESYSRVINLPKIKFF